MRKRKYKLSPLAKEDFLQIVQYTIEKWNLEKATSYTSSLERELENITNFPNIGDNRFQLAQGIRSVVFRKHVIFYRLENEIIIIHRIIHQSMDISL